MEPRTEYSETAGSVEPDCRDISDTEDRAIRLGEGVLAAKDDDTAPAVGCAEVLGVGLSRHLLSMSSMGLGWKSHPSYPPLSWF